MEKEDIMEPVQTFSTLSTEIAVMVERTGPSIVAVQGGRRFASGGVCWKPGLVVTAAHTLRREEGIKVSYGDSRTEEAAGSGDAARAQPAAGTEDAMRAMDATHTEEATLVGWDRGHDLALLRLESADPAGSTGPRPIGRVAGADELRPGRLAVAVGRSNATGLHASLAMISAVGNGWRTWGGGQIDRYIRLNIAGFPGLSGSAVVDDSGAFIGLATTVLSRIAPLVIPAATIERVFEELQKKGHVARGYLGVGLQAVPLPASAAREGSIAQSSAVIVLTVEEAGPAEKAGILVGDLILSIDEVPTVSVRATQAQLQELPPGSAVRLSLLRAGKPVELAVTLEDRPHGRR